MDLLALVHGSPFHEFAALLALASVVGFLGLLLRQPMIVSFIAVGVLSGPSAFGIVRSWEKIQLLAELGVAVLLFLVGLKLDLQLVRSLGPVALTTGLGQVLFTSVIGYGIGIALGLDSLAALYVAVALTFSSTIIIVKLLSDKKEVDSLHGRIAIGFLIVQDLVVVIAMMALSAIGVGGAGDGAGSVLQFVRIVGLGLVVLAGVAVFVRFVADPLAGYLARSPELMVTFAISWAALLAALGSHVGFSKELGGLLAGVSLASTPYREAIVARLAPLRDFLLLFFFIALGSHLDIGALGGQVGPALVFSVFVLVGNPLIVLAIMGAMGYRKRTGFLAGLTVAQISEFSLIFVTMGLTLGHVGADHVGLVTLVGLITIALSVYMITYSQSLYRRLEPLLGIFERSQPFREPDVAEEVSRDGRREVILFGMGRYGGAIAVKLRERGLAVLGVDFNPDEVRRWRRNGFHVVYGDASDPAFLDGLPLAGVEWVVSAMPQHDLGLTHEDPRLVLLDAMRERGFAGRVAVSTHFDPEIEVLEARGAGVVLRPFADAAERAVERLLSGDGERAECDASDAKLSAGSPAA